MFLSTRSAKCVSVARSAASLDVLAAARDLSAENGSSIVGVIVPEPLWLGLRHSVG
jgi:hypothetical protein